MKRVMIAALGVVAIGALLGNPAQAAITVDFEGTLPANVSFGAYNNTSTGTTAGLSTDYAHSATHSAELHLSDIRDEARVKIAGVGGKVGTTSVTYWAYTPAGASITNTPYVELYVDTNNNGVSDGIGSTADSYIITSPTTPLIPGQWVQETLTADTLVHIVGNRGSFGVESGSGSKYSAYNGFGRFGDLLNETYSAGFTWGDMNIFNAYVDTGVWGGSGGPYTAYVDDISVGTVPEPATIVVWGLLGLVAAGFGGWRRRRAG